MAAHDDLEEELSTPFRYASPYCHIFPITPLFKGNLALFGRSERTALPPVDGLHGSSHCRQVQIFAANDVQKRRRPGSLAAQGPADILPPLAWLSLVGVLPSRARLRFTKRLDYSCRTCEARTASQLQNRPNAPTGSTPQTPRREPLLNTREQDITTD